MSEKLNHKQRRKIQRKERRRKKRREKFLCNESAVCDKIPIEDVKSDGEHSCEASKSLPAGCMTNYSIISHFKRLAQEAELLLQLSEEDPWIKNTFLSRSPCEVSKQVDSGPGEESKLPTEPLKPSKPPNELVYPANNDGDTGPTSSTEPPKTLRSEIDDLLSQLDEEVDQWHNPFAPDEDLPKPTHVESQRVDVSHPMPVNYAPPDDERPVCIFYDKVGACKYGDRCSRRHVDLPESEALLFPGMFQTFAFEIAEKSRRQGMDQDVSLEYSDNDLYDEFLDFYWDICPEFKSIGPCKQLYVCCNRMPHLCGNVYVEYADVKSAKKCFEKMNLRFYNGKQLLCRFVSVGDWSRSLCGFYARNGFCSRGDHCNFLHMFRNPSVPRPDTDRHRHRKQRNHKRKRSKSPIYDIDGYSNREHSLGRHREGRRRSKSRSYERERYSSGRRDYGLSENRKRHRSTSRSLSPREKSSRKHGDKSKKRKKRKKSKKGKKKKKHQNENNSE